MANDDFEVEVAKAPPVHELNMVVLLGHPDNLTPHIGQLVFEDTKILAIKNPEEELPDLAKIILAENLAATMAELYHTGVVSKFVVVGFEGATIAPRNLAAELDTVKIPADDVVYAGRDFADDWQVIHAECVNLGLIPKPGGKSLTPEEMELEFGPCANEVNSGEAVAPSGVSLQRTVSPASENRSSSQEWVKTDLAVYVNTITGETQIRQS